MSTAGIRYAHTNVIAREWKALARFYVEVFGCEPVGPERDHHGPDREALTNIPDAHWRGRHFRLPGHGDHGPTLEIFEFEQKLARGGEPVINRPGFTHLAFEVPDVAAKRQEILARGGREIGQVVTLDIPGAGQLMLVYLTDPEGNILELQHWQKV